MEELCDPIVNTGLRGVTIASSRISDVDGKAGKLIYRGYLVQELAENATFEEVVFLLLYERLPRRDELNDFQARLASERRIPKGLINAMKHLPGTAHPMDVLQGAVPFLAADDPDAGTMTREAAGKTAVRLIAKLATVTAAWHRIRKGLDPLPPDETLSHAGNFLYMLSGDAPDAELTRFVDTALILHAEHSFNASTFAAREVASTRAHMYAAVSAAIGSLSGELHGGANARVMEMLLKIRSPENVKRFVDDTLASGGKIMGLGHAVYQTDDPRAFILAPMSKKMGERIGQPQWYDISVRLEKAGKAAFKKKKGTDIYVNVDFYCASLYYAMGIPIDLFTPVFAVSRVSGWATHVIEEQYADAAAKPMLYRPESEYIGDYCGPDICEYIPIDRREDD